MTARVHASMYAWALACVPVRESAHVCACLGGTAHVGACVPVHKHECMHTREHACVGMLARWQLCKFLCVPSFVDTDGVHSGHMYYKMSSLNKHVEACSYNYTRAGISLSSTSSSKCIFIKCNKQAALPNSLIR